MNAVTLIGPPLRTMEATWRSAILYTIGLWSFVLALYMPIIYGKHADDPTGLLLDSSTVLLSILFALPLFGLLRATAVWPGIVRGPVMLGAVILAALAQTVFDYAFTRFVAMHVLPRWEDMPQSIVRSYTSLFNYVCVFGTNAVIFNLILSRDRVREQERALAEARSSAQNAQLAALRFQINPHFLFNTLNAISALIVTRRNAHAEAMTEKLSSFLRASLASDPHELVPLAEELAIVSDYLDIESVRFGTRLEPLVDCTPDAEQALVPSFILQPLVENAVKYGVSPTKHPVRVRVGAEIDDGELVLCVEDNGPCEDAGIPLPSTGTGLRNVRQRLQALFGARAQLTTARNEGCFRACIRMPARSG